MTSDPETLALITATYLLAGIVKGVTGLGIPIIGVAFVAPILGLQAAIAILLAPSVVTNFWQAVVGRNFLKILSRLWPMLATAVGGIWLGSGILAAADGRLLIFVLGTVLISYSVIALLRAKLPSPGDREPWLTPIIGGVAGVIFGMTGSFMVPGTLYVQSLGMPRDMFVQALGITFVGISVTLALMMTQRTMLTLELAVLSVAAVIPTMLGMVAGQRLRRVLTEEQFTRIVLVVIMITGVYMVARSYLAI